MDESFKRLEKEFQVSYHKSFWDEAKIALENDALDNAFRSAATSSTKITVPNWDNQGLEEAFMDEAFRDAAQASETKYQASFWNDFENQREELEEKDAFQTAAQQIKATYNPIFWENANTELEKEGLHYEYQSAYWNEAKELLDKSDRRRFIGRWSAVAIALLLISLGGFNFDGVESNQNHVRYEREASLDQRLKSKNDNFFNIAENHQPTRNQKFDLVGSVKTPINKDVELQDEANNNEISADVFDQNKQAVLSHGETNIVAENHYQEEQLKFAKDASLKALDKRTLNNKRDSRSRISHLQQNERIQNYEYSLLTPIELKNRPKLNVQNLSVIAGFGFGRGYGINQNFNLPRAYLGVDYSRKGSNKFNRFEFGGGLGVKGLKEDGIVHEKRTVRYMENTNALTSWRKLKINDLIYGNLNLFLSFNIRSKHWTTVGVGLEKLLAVRSNMAYFINDTKTKNKVEANAIASDDLTDIKTVNNNWGVQEGIRRNDLNFTIGYEYRLNYKFSLQTKFNFGLFDRTDDDFYNQDQTFNNEMNATVGIRYRFFTKI